MATIPLPPDFSEFLKLLNESGVKYLLVGGYAVGFHGYVRATADMDIWVGQDRDNAERLVEALRRFGFDVPQLTPDLFVKPDQIIRMGYAPVRLEIMTSIDGVTFDTCYENRVEVTWDDLRVTVISLDDLRENKRASGRLKDLSDLEMLDD